MNDPTSQVSRSTELSAKVAQMMQKRLTIAQEHFTERARKAYETYGKPAAAQSRSPMELWTDADFHWEHMGREESVILPAAQRHLTEADWAEINSAFTDDPGIRISGELDTEFHHLLAQIVALDASPERR